VVGGSTAYFGFTGGTGGLTVTQNVLSWSYSSGNAKATTVPAFGNGQFTASSFYLNGGATVTSNGILQITDGLYGEARSAWYTTQLQVGNFTTDFTFQLMNANADGMTFTIQGQSPYALGGSGGSLGYQGISNSVAIKFDPYNNAGEGSDSTGFYINGAMPTTPAIDLTSSGINLHSGDVMDAHVVYDGTNLTMTLTDTVTGNSAVEVFHVNLPSVVGGSTAYFGFTGGTGGLTVTQNVLSWSYSSGSAIATTTPSISNFSVAANPAALATTAGQSASAQITITSHAAFTSPITLTCSGLPSGASCSFTPQTVNLSAGSASTTLTINTSMKTATLNRNSNPLLPGSMLAATLCFYGWKRRRGLSVLIALLAVGLSTCTGCGVSMPLSPSQPVISTVSITATAGNQQSVTTMLTLTMQ
jgi:hypothetical protein